MNTVRVSWALTFMLALAVILSVPNLAFSQPVENTQALEKQYDNTIFSGLKNEALKNRIKVSDDGKVLMYKGLPITNAERDELIGLSPDPEWKTAITALAAKTQRSGSIGTADSDNILKSMSFNNEDILTVLNGFSKAFKLNIVASKEVRGTVNINLNNVPVLVALDAILASQNLMRTVIRNPAPDGKDVYLIVVATAPLAQLDKWVEAIPRSAPTQVPLEFKSLIEQLEKMKSGAGRIVSNENARVLFVEDTPKAIALMKEYYAKVRESLPEREPEQVSTGGTGTGPGPGTGPGTPPGGQVGATPTQQQVAVERRTKVIYRVGGRDFPTVMEDLKKLLGTRPAPINEKEGIFMVEDLETTQALVKAYLDEIAKIKAPEVPITEQFTTRVYVLKQKAEDVKAAMAPFITEKGAIVVNTALNSLIIKDRYTNFENIERYIRELDAVPQQVLIESTILEATLTDNTDFGLTSGWQRGAGSLGLGYASPDFNPATVPPGSSFFRTFNTSRYNFGFVKAGEWEAALTALQRTQDANILSRPKMNVVNNKEGSIKVGTEIPYITSTGSSSGAAAQGVAFKPVTLTMRVIPHIEPGDRIRLEVDITIDAQTGTVTLLGGAQPIVSTRAVKTEIYVNSGETLVIGGLYEDRQTDTISQVPILGDLPVLGALFRNTSVTHEKRDVLFLITPNIVKDRTEVKLMKLQRELRVYRPITPQIPEWYKDHDNSRLRGGVQTK